MAVRGTRVYRFGPYQMDVPNGLLWLHEYTVQAPPRVFQVLTALVERAGELVSKEDLVGTVWGGAFIEDSNITKCIAEIRRILRPGFGAVNPIQTVTRKGYRFVIPVETVLPPPEPLLPVPATEPPIPAPPAELPAVPAAVVPPAGRRMRLLLAVAMLTGLAVLVPLVPRLKPPARQGRPAVAVLGIRNLSNDRSADWLSTALSETLTSELQSSRGALIVPVDRVSALRTELGLSQNTEFDAATLERVRTNLGCQFAVIGTVLPVASGLRVDLQIRNTDTGESRGAFSTTGSTQELLEMVARSGVALRRILGETTLAEAATPQRGVSAEALRLYAEGVVRLRAGDAPGAQELLSKAESLAKDYAPIHTNLSLAWSQIGMDGRALEEARLAMASDTAAPREQQLTTEARYAEVKGDWLKAAGIWRALWTFAPDDLGYVDRLASALTNGGKAKDALAALQPLRSNDPRLLLTESSALLALTQYREAIPVANRALAEARRRSARFLESRILACRGSAFGGLSEYEKARADFKESGRISSGLGDRSGFARALLEETEIARKTGGGDGLQLAEQALAVAREIGDRNLTVSALISLTQLHRSSADLAGAIRLADEALGIAREIGNVQGEATLLNDLGNLYNNTGRPAEARQRYDASLEKSTAIGYRRGIMLATGNLGILDYTSGDLARATTRFEEALRLKRQTGDRDSIAYTLSWLGRVSVMAGNFDAAHRYLEEADQMYRAIGEESVFPVICLASLDVAEGRPEKAEERLLPLTPRYTRPAPGVEIWLGIAESRLARGKIAEAREASGRASALAARSANRADFGIPTAIMAARVAVGASTPAQRRRELETLLAEARHLDHVPNQLRARLAIAQVEYSQDPRHAVETARELQRDSARAGFRTIASAAQQILTTGVAARQSGAASAPQPR